MAKSIKTDEEILAFFDASFKTDLDTSRQIYELTWFRNILYYLGEQWFDWYEQSTMFKRRYNLNSNIPTPVFNMIRDHVRSSKALVLNKKYVTRVWPNSEEEEDKAAARTGTELIQWLNSLDDNAIQDVKEMVVIWMILTGNGFARTFPDKDTGKFIRTKDKSVIDAPVEIGTEELSPFNVILPALGTKLEHKRWIGIKTLRDVEWIEDTYDIKLDGGESDNRIVDYEKQLLSLVASVSPWKGRGLSPSSADLETGDKAVYKEIEVRPTKEYPEGRYLVVVNGQVVVDKANLPIPTDKRGNWNYSLTHFPLNRTPGSFWAVGSVDDLISPQNNVNEIDQALATNRKTLGRPWVLTPSNVILKRISERGVGLLNITYNAREAGMHRPVIEQGTPYPQQILEERMNHRQAAQDTSGDPKNVLKGGTPHAGASGVLVDILRESAEQSHSPDIDRFYRNWNKLDRKRLILAQHVIQDTRLIKVQGEGSEVFVREFRGANLRDNTDTRCELDSGLSSTNTGKNEMLLRMAQYGIFGDLRTNVTMQREVVKRFGLSGLPEESNLHAQRAERENMRLKSGEVERIALPNLDMKDPETGEPVIGEDNQVITMFPRTSDPVFKYDEHAIHIAIHDQAIFAKEFEKWPEKNMMMALAHRDLHIAMMEMEMQKSLEAAQGPPEQEQPPEPQPGDVGADFANMINEEAA